MGEVVLQLMQNSIHLFLIRLTYEMSTQLQNAVRIFLGLSLDRYTRKVSEEANNETLCN